jgi:predicted small integral membrane protein
MASATIAWSTLNGAMKSMATLPACLASSRIWCWRSLKTGIGLNLPSMTEATWFHFFLLSAILRQLWRLTNRMAPPAVFLLIFGLDTTRGDRLFTRLLGSAFIFLDGWTVRRAL